MSNWQMLLSVVVFVALWTGWKKIFHGGRLGLGIVWLIAALIFGLAVIVPGVRRAEELRQARATAI